MHSGRRVAPGRVGGLRRRRYNIPESFRAFCSIVSFTAAKTSRMLEVSVACVRLMRSMTAMYDGGMCDLLGIEVEMSAVNLVKPPKQVLRRTVYVVSA